MTATDADVLDRSTLDAIRDLESRGCRDALVRLVDAFLAESGPLLERMEDAAERGDLAELRRSAHFLRSGALGLGAGELASACEALEHVGDAAVAHLPRDLAALRAAWLDSSQALLGALRERRAGPAA